MLARCGGERISESCAAGDGLVEDDVFGLGVGRQTLVAHPRLRRRFSGKLVRQRVVPHHQLRVLAGGLRQAIVDSQRLQPVLRTSLVDESDHLRFSSGIDLRRLLTRAGKATGSNKR